jgi:3-methyladenine DNA glycosylase AlkD
MIPAISTMTKLTAKTFLDRLRSHASEIERKKYQRYFKFTDEKPLKDDEFIGVRMGQVFELAKEFIAMPIAEIEKLMESQIHEARAGAMSIMGKRAAAKKTTDAELKELYDLYLRRHDRVNDWDLVDLASYHVVGRYLADKPRKPLYKLAKSKDQWERRTAIVSTAHFIRQKDVTDTFKLAEILVHDEQEPVQKGVGWMLRFAGDVDREQLIQFLDKHSETMPRIMLRNAIEKLAAKERSKYLAMKSKP